MIEVWVRYRPEVERELFAQLPPHSFHRVGSLYEVNVKCLDPEELIRRISLRRELIVECLDREQADLLVVNLNVQEALEASVKEPWRDCAARTSDDPHVRSAKGRGNSSGIEGETNG